MTEHHDTVFDEEPSEDTSALAEIDFGLLEAQGRWLLKVVSGPNSGAEFSMVTGSGYLIGTDTAACDIVFNDLSVSRQHARIAVDPQNVITVEDLGSRNGTFVDGEKINDKKAVSTNVLITMGTTTVMLIDREGERATIFSPAFGPSPTKKEAETPPEVEGKNLGPAVKEAVLAPIMSEVDRLKEKERHETRRAYVLSTLVVLAAVTGLLIVVALGTRTLFKTEEIVQEKITNPEALIAKALQDFPKIRYSFNQATGRLLLIGHLSSPVDVTKLQNNLSQLKFITFIDMNNVIIDEYVWREINQLFAKNSAWKSVTISSPEPGKFVMTGSLKTRKQAEELNEYLSQNFLYLDLLERKIVVEEELKADILRRLINAGLKNVSVNIGNGDIQLQGSVPVGGLAKINVIVDDIKKIPGIRSVQTFVSEVTIEQAAINISDRYKVTGYSSQGKNISVVINGRIVSKGDSLDGMHITDISPNAILLEKEGFKYRIDFNR